MTSKIKILQRTLYKHQTAKVKLLVMSYKIISNLKQNYILNILSDLLFLNSFMYIDIYINRKNDKF